MHDKARTTAEDRVKLVFARRREAHVAPLLEADELFVAEVPAPRPLVEISSHRALVANLRRADLDRGERDRGIQLRDLGVLREIDQLHRGADFQASARHRRDGRVQRPLDVDDPIRLGDVVFQSREQILAACERHHLFGLRAERADRFFFVPGIDVRKRFHSSSPRYVRRCASVCRIFAGVSGRLRTVTPMAFRTALAMAAAVDTVGGSPIPITPRSD